MTFLFQTHLVHLCIVKFEQNSSEKTEHFYWYRHALQVTSTKTEFAYHAHYSLKTPLKRSKNVTNLDCSVTHFDETFNGSRHEGAHS